MIRTLLVNPPYSLEERYGRRMKGFGAVSEPMGLAYLAGSLGAQGLPVEILDAPATGVCPDHVVERVHCGGFGLVGITFLTPMFSAVADLTRRIKALCPETHVVAGGPHPTALPERTLKEIPWIDSLCIGEGERTMVDLVSALFEGRDLREVNGLAHRCEGSIVVNPHRPFEQNLDLLPKPARNLLPLDLYKLTASRTRGSDFCPTLIVARGCPFNCQFCSHPFGRSFRRHSVDRIIEELKELKDKYGSSQVNLEADTLTIDRKFLLELCQAMVREGLNLSWTCESRVDTVDEEMLRAMKRAGCWQISYGVESGSQRLLEIIQKGVTREQVAKTFLLTRKVGITIRGFFMLGLPTETPAESRETIEFARRLDPLWAQFTVTVPYPGTPLFESLDGEGKIRHYDWSHYNTWGGWADTKLPYVPDGRTERELKNLQKKAVRLYYMRPVVALRFVKSLNSLSDLKKYLRGLMVLLKSR